MTNNQGKWIMRLLGSGSVAQVLFPSIGMAYPPFRVERCKWTPVDDLTVRLEDAEHVAEFTLSKKENDNQVGVLEIEGAELKELMGVDYSCKKERGY